MAHNPLWEVLLECNPQAHLNQQRGEHSFLQVLSQHQGEFQINLNIRPFLYTFPFEQLREIWSS